MVAKGTGATQIGLGSDLADRRRIVVREFLRKHGLTPKQLGRRGGFNPDSIYNLLNGVSGSLSAGTLKRMLAAVPGATADDLLLLVIPQNEKGLPQAIQPHPAVQKSMRSGTLHGSIFKGPHLLVDALVSRGRNPEST